MPLFSWLFARRGNLQGTSESGDENSSNVSGRRRTLGNLTPAEGESLVAEPGPSRAKQAPKVARKLDGKGKRNAASLPVTESISVILRRQVPIRFDEEARSWLGGLPRMPVGMEWPRAKPKKPLHFVAQLDCAGLPAGLWGGLGPRDGWLLLFVDIEAIDEEARRPIARVLHVAEMGAEAEPPAGLYFARRDVVDLGRLPSAPPGAQRRHFRKWPVDFVPAPADTRGLTGSQLYGAPDNDLLLGARGTFTRDRPMTWRGAYTMLAELVQRHNANGYESNWVGNSGGLLDYPEPDTSDFNKVWQERRQRLPEWNQTGFYEADARLKAQIHEERRKGWSQRAFKVLDEEATRSIAHLDDYRAKLAAARGKGDDGKAHELQQSVDYFEKQLADRQAHRAYLEALFAQYSEDELTVEIRRVGQAHIEWAQRTQDQLGELLAQVAATDLDAPVAPSEWDAIVARIEVMKTEYWKRTYETDVLRKIEAGVHFDLEDVIREEVLDCYASPPSSAEGLDPDTIADLEPQLRQLECDGPHKLGGLIDSVYGNPLQNDHVLLFQVASDAAPGWIWGDLGMIYVSIHPSDLRAGSFDNVEAWLEA